MKTMRYIDILLLTCASIIVNVSCQDSGLEFIGGKGTVHLIEVPPPVTECNAGWFRISGEGEPLMCQQWTACGVNEQEIQAPSSESDRICGPTMCQEGTFQASTGDEPLACQTWTVCGPGEFESQPPSFKNDRVCAPIQPTVCENGMFKTSAEGEPLACQLWTVCGPDESEVQEPTPERDRTCAPTPCQNGMYRTSPPGAPVTCQPWTACGPNEVEAQAPTPEMDRMCMVNPCRRGTVEHMPPTPTSPRVCRVVYRNCTGPDGVMRPNRDEFAVPGKGCRVYLYVWAEGEPNDLGDSEDFVHALAGGWNDAHFSGYRRNDPNGGGKYICATGDIPDYSNLSRVFTIHDAADRQRVCPPGSVFAKPETLEEQRVIVNQFNTEVRNLNVPVWINFHREADNTFQSTQ